MLFERGRHVVALVVDARVKPEVLHNNSALLRPAGDADHPGPGDLGDLPGDRSGGTGGRGDHHRLAGLWPTDIGHAEIGGGAT